MAATSFLQINRPLGTIVIPLERSHQKSDPQLRLSELPPGVLMPSLPMYLGDRGDLIGDLKGDLSGDLKGDLRGDRSGPEIISNSGSLSPR